MASCPMRVERNCDTSPHKHRQQLSHPHNPAVRCGGEPAPHQLLALVELTLGQSGLLLLDIESSAVTAWFGQARALLRAAEIRLQLGDRLHPAGAQLPLHAILARIRKGQTVASARVGENRDLIAVATRFPAASQVGLEDMVLVRLLPVVAEMPRSDLLEEAFAMSPAEAQVVLLMAQGCTARQASVVRGSTYNTVRDQLTKALAKADLPSQKDLLPLVCRMA